MCIGIYKVFFIHSSVDGHLDCFHVLGIMGCAAVNRGVHESFQGIVFFFSGYILRIGNVGSYGNSVFVFFEELPYCFPQWLQQITLPQQCKKVSHVSTCSPASIIHHLLNDGPSDRYEVVPQRSVSWPFSTNEQC